jgi:hypothetical protein
MTSKMNIDDFLQFRGVDLPSIIENVKQTVGLAQDDILLAVGSLVEGHGNHKSDLDLLLITSRTDGILAHEKEIPLVTRACLADLQSLRPAGLHELCARFHAWNQEAWDVNHAAKFTLAEHKLLHRLLHGRILSETQLDAALPDLPSRRDLARLKLHVARHMSRTIQVDMVGNRADKDWQTLTFAAQTLLGHAIDALTAGHEITNPTEKWRFRFLDQLPPDWENRLGCRPTGLSARDLYWRLHRAPERPGEKPCLEHAFRISAFARAVFAWAESSLIFEEDRAPAQVDLSHDPQGPAELLPYLDLDVDFLLRGDYVYIAQLNEFHEPLEFPAHALSLFLLCDGVTTKEEAEAYLRKNSDYDADQDGVEQWLAELTQAALSVPATA